MPTVAAPSAWPFYRLWQGFLNLPGLPPPAVLRIYSLAWLPVALIYMVAAETDGDWSRGFNFLSAVQGMARNLSPQFFLLLLLWPITGWMERRGFGPARTVLNHVGLAFLFAFAWHGVLWLLIALQYSIAAAERARANWFIWQMQWGMMMYFAAAGGFSAYRAVQRARAEAAAAAQAQTLLARTELAALRNRLNPHFLFNTLHSILALVRKDAKGAEEALFKFSDMLRYLLDTERSGDDQVMLRDEMAFTEQYLSLEAIRLGERLQLDWQVDAHALTATVPALTVQPLVENSIKHAFNPRSQAGHLRVHVRREGERLCIDVADDGPGCALQPDGSLPPGTGSGLSTVMRRLALQYGAAGAFKINTAPNAGFAVRLELPLHLP
jgi:signal transduction histidine kinase